MNLETNLACNLLLYTSYVFHSILIFSNNRLDWQIIFLHDTTSPTFIYHKLKTTIYCHNRAINHNIAMQIKLIENTKRAYSELKQFCKIKLFCKNQAFFHCKNHAAFFIYKSPYFLSSNVDTNFVTCFFCKDKSILMYYYHINIVCIL